MTLLRRHDHAVIKAFEQAIVNADDGRAPAGRYVLARHAALAPLADAIVMLSAPGPAPLRAADPLCHTPSALLHAPAVSLPLMAVEGMPVGAQLLGQSNQDDRVLSLARWVAIEAGTVVV